MLYVACAQWNVQTPVKHMLKANEKGPQWKDGHAPAVQRPADASKQFLVKIQAALDGVSHLAPAQQNYPVSDVARRFAGPEAATGADNVLL